MDYPFDYYEDDCESFYCDLLTIYLSQSTQRGAKTTERGKTRDGGRKATGLSGKTTCNNGYLGQTASVPVATALLTSEEENFSCRVVPVVARLGKSRCIHGWEYNPSCLTNTNGFTVFINIVVLETVSPPQNQLDEKSEAGWDKRSAPHGKKNVISACNCVWNHSM